MVEYNQTRDIKKDNRWWKKWWGYKSKSGIGKNKKLMRRKIRFKTKTRLLNCYVFRSVKLCMRELDLDYSNDHESKCIWDVVLQKNAKDKLDGQVEE